MTGPRSPRAPTAQELESLQRSELFAGLDPDVLRAIVQTARRRRYQPDTFLFRQGQPASALHLLTAGRVKLTQITPDGQQILLRVIGPGEVFGTIATLGDAVYPVSAEGATACLALVWSGATILDLMERFPRLALNIVRVLASRVQEFQARYRELATERVERRVARALLRLVQQTGQKVPGGILIDLALSRQDLAEMTGTTLFTVSRILRGWEQRGLVESGRERVLVKQPHELVVIAEDLPPPAAPPPAG